MVHRKHLCQVMIINALLKVYFNPRNESDQRGPFSLEFHKSKKAEVAL
jgi:hypothetical protein